MESDAEIIDKKGRIDIKNGRKLVKENKLEEALEYFLKAKAKFGEIYLSPNIKNESLFKNLGFCLFKLHQLVNAHEILTLYIEIQTYNPNLKTNKRKQENLGRAYFYNAIYFKKIKNDAENELANYIGCRDLWEESSPPDRFDHGTLYNNIGIILSFQGKGRESFDFERTSR